jgi:hypothetical protein
MLRDGQFIKEAPPRIGAFYVPKFYKTSSTPEERMVQSLLLGFREDRASFLSKVFGILMRA